MVETRRASPARTSQSTMLQKRRAGNSATSSANLLAKRESFKRRELGNSMARKPNGRRRSAFLQEDSYQRPASDGQYKSKKRICNELPCPDASTTDEAFTTQSLVPLSRATNITFGGEKWNGFAEIAERYGTGMDMTLGYKSMEDRKISSIASPYRRRRPAPSIA